MTHLRAPFPWFGGKSRVAPLVWERFGNVPNYVEPFFGSGAVLLGRPHRPGTETVNDLDAYLANFWRAVRSDPETVARWADYPVNEADILARHEWLLSLVDFRVRMRTDPDYFDAKVAGWWLWGICSWIGSGWCQTRAQQLPHLGSAGQGIHRKKLPHLGDAGQGIHRKKLPHLGDAGRGIALTAYMEELAERLREVRVACGEWDRILGESVTVKHGTTGVFLDPPYDEGEHAVRYSAGTGSVASRVRAWALENGDNPDLRIALCGYAGEHDEMEGAGWSVEAWKTAGGFASQGDGRGRENTHRERIWFSPHCLPKEQPSLFSEGAA
jgi:DNA adenine methylase